MAERDQLDCKHQALPNDWLVVNHGAPHYLLRRPNPYAFQVTIVMGVSTVQKSIMAYEIN